MDNRCESLLSCIPAPGEAVDWARIGALAPATTLSQLAQTSQNPAWHGEGDVLTHTKMVCDSLVGLPAYAALSLRQRQAVFLAALLHDIGKPSCTRREGGVLISPNHARVGAALARDILWRTFNLCGEPEAQQLRESVCALIRWHTFPLHAFEHAAPDHRAIEIASEGDKATLFSNHLLCLLAEADMRGRIARDTAQKLEKISFYAELSSEAECLNAPFVFDSTYSRFAYLSGRNIAPAQPLFDDTWGPVVLLYGLPGTGKDTYIGAHLPDLPVVSLDALRDKLHISPIGPQGAVVAAAKEQATGYLRKHQPFVWNATNITASTREPLVSLFSRYGASTRIVYLEAEWGEQLRRNAERARSVPESAIERMLQKLVPPASREARGVDWLCV